MRSNFVKYSINGLRACFVGTLLLAASTSVAWGQLAWTPPQAGFPQTAPEISGFESYTNHVAMWEYLEGLRGASSDMRLSSYGETREGREIPYAVFSRPPS